MFCLRFGHSMIQGMIKFMHETTGDELGEFSLSSNFFNLAKYYGETGEGMERLIKGLITQSAQDNDRFVSEEVTRRLFPGAGRNFGDDLVALNVMRGRDHGLPGYNDWRIRCGMDPVCSFDEKPGEIGDQAKWEALRDLYEAAGPGNIDLFTAGLAEDPVDGGVTGPTFSCIIAKQFRRLMYGDRFFFTHERSKFDDDQLAAIRRRTLADIICDNTKITETPENVFLRSSLPRKCDEKNVLDLDLFL